MQLLWFIFLFGYLAMAVHYVFHEQAKFKDEQRNLKREFYKKHRIK